MNKGISAFLILVVSAAIFLLERDFMFNQDVVGETNVSITVYIGMVFLASAIPMVFSRKKRVHNLLTRRFTVLMLVTYIISLLFSFIHPFGSRNSFVFIILPLLVFYFPMNVSSIKSNKLFLWAMTAVFVMLSMYYYFNYSHNVLYSIEQQYNGSYAVLYLLPFILCYKNNLIKWGGMAIAVFIVMISLKRGGFIAAVAAIVIYFLITVFMTKGSRLGFWRFMIVVGATIAMSYLVIYINGAVLGDSMFNRLEEMGETEGGGRLSIYGNYLSFIGSDDIIHWIFGHGWQGSIIDSGIKATCHNDFLEVFVDFGLIGFIAYIGFWVALVKFGLKMIRIKHEYAPAMGVSIAIFFVNSMVAHIFIYSWYMIIFTLFWGFVLSSLENKVMENNTQSISAN